MTTKSRVLASLALVVLGGCVDFNNLDRCFGGACTGDAGTSSVDAGPGPKASCVAQLAAGWTHSCARMSRSQLWCWGNNNAAQVGPMINRENVQLAPVEIYASGVSDVVNGDSFTCGIVSGKVLCWGFNHKGQLGDGGADKEGPVTVPSVPSPVSLVAGFAHACALQVGGKVSCWGLNADGQLGINGGGENVKPVEVPVTDVAELAAGFGHTCARRNDGAVVCWGRNDDGERGDTDPAERPTPGAPVLTDVAHVAAGLSHTCAVKRDGSLYCWGLNSVGQLGDGTTSNRNAPTLVRGVSNVVQVSMGGIKTSGLYGHTCARTAAGEVYCWGGNQAGELGFAGGNASEPKKVPGLSDVSSLAVGALHTCAARPDGVYCWGSSEKGQLGTGSVASQVSPTATQLTCR